MKTALVTGGSRGIGRAIVEEFCASGYRVGFTYAVNRDAAQALADCLTARGHTVAFYQADVRDITRAHDVVRQLQEELGPLNVLVNNAGIRKDGAFNLMDSASWTDVIDTNLTGTFNYARAVIRQLMRTGGSVINITSTAGEMGVPGQVNYCASKAGVIGLTRALAREVARFGVRVNAIAPGYISTDMTAGIDEATRKKLYSQIPLGKPGTVAEVAQLACFLAEHATYATGQVWALDGGLT